MYLLDLSAKYMIRVCAIFKHIFKDIPHHMFQIQLIHFVKFYINSFCILNVVFGFCAKLHVMFFNMWVPIPVSIINIITSLRSILLWQSRGKDACALAVNVSLQFWPVPNFQVDFFSSFQVRFIFGVFGIFGFAFVFWLVFIFGVIVIFGTVSFFCVFFFFFGCLSFGNCL